MTGHRAPAQRGRFTSAMADLSTILPAVRDQGDRETCLTIALTDGHHVTRADAPALAPDFLHFHAAALAGVGVNDAVPVAAGMAVLMDNGQPAEAECPYSPIARPASWLPSTPSGGVWKRVTSVAPGAPWKVIEDEVGGGRPVALVIEIDDPFWTPVDGVVSIPSGPARTSHAVLAVEIDLQMSRVRVRNSWGNEWGDGGYAWLSAGYVTARCTAVVKFGGPVS